jgi:hypothetical protein
MNKKIHWAVIIMISTLANSATATPLTKHLVLTQEKKSLVQSLVQVAITAGSTCINNDISTYAEENPKLEAKPQKKDAFSQSASAVGKSIVSRHL